MSTRPKPRPRPRPRVASSAQPSSPGPSSATSPPPKDARLSAPVEDEDAMFMRNRNRTAQSWKNLEKLTSEKENRTLGTVREDSSDVEISDGVSSPPRKHKKTKNGKGSALPDWTKMSESAIIVSSSDEDDDIILQRLDDHTHAAQRKQGGAELQKRTNRKRTRSRSNSITPPPAVPIEVIQNARDTIRQMLGGGERISSPILIADESADTIVLDPELANIARQVQLQTYNKFATPAFSRSVTPAVDSGGGPGVVSIKVKWKCHPLDDAGKPQTWGFKMKRHDSFKELFEETADLAAVLSDNLIVSFDGKRVFPSASPHGIGVWEEAELEACDKTTYEYIRSQRRRSPSIALDDGGRSHSRAGSLSPTQEESEESDAESTAGAGDKFKLTLRSAVTKDIILTVRPTTKCGAIIKAFLKSAGIADKYPMATTSAKATKAKGRKRKGGASSEPMLMVDGDKMDPEALIGDADLEDGDLVEVVGL